MDKIKELVTSYKLPVALTLLGVVLLGGGIYSSFPRLTPTALKIEDLPKASLVSAENITKDITIDISGAVKSPGVYRFEKESRVKDAIEEAGGFSEQVNRQYVSKSLNLATKLTDGQKLYIPYEGELASIAPATVLIASTTTGSNTTNENKGKINLNSASQSDLETLPAIGPVTAAKIMTGRPLNSVGELLSKKLVSKSAYDKIKSLVEI